MKGTVIKRYCSTYFVVLLEFFCHLGIPTMIFLYLSFCFNAMEINSNHKIFFAFLAVCLIYLLSKTVKPILVRITIPLTGLSLGLFYFVINMIIFKMVDILMIGKLNFYGILPLFGISILFSLFSTFFETLFSRFVIRRIRHE